MDYVIRIEEALPRQLAVVHASTTRAELGRTIIRLLDLVWPVLRTQKVKTGHNVVVYKGGLSRIEAGVEVFGPFEETGEVRASSTPGGAVATTAHWGAYSEMGAAYAALEHWCAEHGRRPSATSWEVYGDWHDDPQQTRTDIYLLLEAPAT
jgi:GyrI-like small molecule binding domain